MRGQTSTSSHLFLLFFLRWRAVKKEGRESESHVGVYRTHVHLYITAADQPSLSTAIQFDCSSSFFNVYTLIAVLEP